jgi:hypothetical protein
MKPRKHIADFFIQLFVTLMLKKINIYHVVLHFFKKGLIL